MASTRDETAAERHDRNWQDILQELRVTMTGTQLISGFLLAVAFQSRFDELDAALRVHYLVLVGLAAIATLTGLAPVAVHRSLFGLRIKHETVRLGDGMLVVTLAIVALLVIGVASFIFSFVLGAVAGVVVGAIAAFVVATLWLLGIRARRAA